MVTAMTKTGTPKFTAAQQRALDEWRRRMGGVANDPHFEDAVFPRRSNAESALRRSARKLLALGVFVELPDHRWQLAPAFRVVPADPDSTSEPECEPDPEPVPLPDPAEQQRRQAQALDAYRERFGTFQPSSYQAAIFDWILFGEGDAVVSAVAGSGKTTTLVQAAKLLRDEALFLAFNKHITEELGRRLAGTPMRAKTIHSIGMGCLTARLSGGARVQIDERKYRKIVRELVWREVVRQAGPDQQKATDALFKVANFARLTLTPPSDSAALSAMMDHYNVECEPYLRPLVIAAVPSVLRAGEQLAEREHLIDFTDMVWLPAVWHLQPPQTPWVFCDEAQDLNRAQLELVMRCRAPGGRMLFVGDPRQSIMGFAGADSDSFWNIQRRTGAKLLPLSICYRCPSSHLELAREIVPEIEARPDAPAGDLGDVLAGALADELRGGDMILCRLTAPLIRQCIELIQRRVPAKVRGRDIGKQLCDLARAVPLMTGYTGFADFGQWLALYESDQIAKLQQREGTEGQVESLIDRAEAVRVCWQSFGAATLDELCAQIDALFDDGQPQVLLSTVHRAKGLENERVFILKPEKLPLVWPKQQPWQAEQEDNLRYVALTRAKQALYFVR